MAARPSATTELPRGAWGILAVVYFSGLAAPLNQFKIPPAIHQITQAVGIGMAEAGLLMSIFSLVGIALALPSGLILQRLGLKATGVLALTCLCLGSLCGGFAPGAGFLLFSRIIEGIGMCLMFIMAPAALAVWFPPERRGTAMGVWGSWVPAGALLMLNLSPVLATRSWTPAWWLGAAYAAVMLLVFARFFRLPPQGEPRPAPVAPDLRRLRALLANRDAWLLAAAFCSQNMMFLSVSTFMPVFLETVRGVPNHNASFITSIIMAGCAVSGALCGLVSEGLRSRRILITFPLLVLTLMMFLPFRADADVAPVLMGTLGFVTGFIPTAIFILVQETARDGRDIGISLAVVALGQNLGMFVGPALFGLCITRFGWVLAAEMFIPIGLLGFGAALLLRVE